MRVAIITGASSGLGREYARYADARHEYDQIWAIARRVERLEELAKECSTPVRCIPLDLGARESIGELVQMMDEASARGTGSGGTDAGETACDEATSEAAGASESIVELAQMMDEASARGFETSGADADETACDEAASEAAGASEPIGVAEDGDTFEVGLLVNAAGFGKFGMYDDMTQEEVDSMIDLNCRALVDITQACLPHMRKGGHIIEIASSASFQPLPGLNVYAASKAFVRSYTRALRFELRGKGIYVTAVCPIWVKTEFIKVARETSNGQTVKHPWPQANARNVVRWSSFINRINYPVATCGLVPFLMRVADKIIPAPLIMWIWEGLRRI